MPEYQGLGVKVARHFGPEVDPDVDDRTVGEEYRQVVRGFLRGHMPALADAPIDLTEICLYTVAPDEDFLVDFHPARPDVIVASPCSGHGFKFSCLIGRVLADLAAEGGDRLAHRGLETRRSHVIERAGGSRPRSNPARRCALTWYHQGLRVDGRISASSRIGPGSSRAPGLDSHSSDRPTGTCSGCLPARVSASL